jgi:hypothetical protein
MAKKNEDALVLALACGATVEGAARQCEVNPRTVNRRLREPAFAARVRDLRADMVRRASGLLTAAAAEAVRTLLALQKDSVPPATRLGAARAVLELGIKVRELSDLEDRVSLLERAAEGGAGAEVRVPADDGDVL